MCSTPKTRNSILAVSDGSLFLPRPRGAAGHAGLDELLDRGGRPCGVSFDGSGGRQGHPEHEEGLPGPRNPRRIPTRPSSISGLSLSEPKLPEMWCGFRPQDTPNRISRPPNKGFRPGRLKFRVFVSSGTSHPSQGKSFKIGILDPDRPGRLPWWSCPP